MENSTKKALFIGRWQPLHKGHEWLIYQKLKRGVPCLVLVRDIEPDEQNPFTTEQTVELLKTRFADEDVTVMAIPDIESVNWGRSVGYETIEHVPPDDICNISATDIRKSIFKGDDSWKSSVDERIQPLVQRYLIGNMDNIRVAEFLARISDLNVTAIYDWAHHFDVNLRESVNVIIKNRNTFSIDVVTYQTSLNYIYETV